MRSQTCCFTGHRNIPPEAWPALSQRLEAAVERLIGEGYRRFAAGGALGFDTMAAGAVLRLRKKYPQIRLILVLPCPSQADRWPAADIAVYRRILRQADQVVYTSQCYTRGCMFLRNRRLVDLSSVCLCYRTSPTGGTAYTVRYAQSQGLRVENLA